MFSLNLNIAKSYHSQFPPPLVVQSSTMVLRRGTPGRFWNNQVTRAQQHNLMTLIMLYLSQEHQYDDDVPLPIISKRLSPIWTMVRSPRTKIVESFVVCNLCLVYHDYYFYTLHNILFFFHPTDNNGDGLPKMLHATEKILVDTSKPTKQSSLKALSQLS